MKYAKINPVKKGYGGFFRGAASGGAAGAALGVPGIIGGAFVGGVMGSRAQNKADKISQEEEMEQERLYTDLMKQQKEAYDKTMLDVYPTKGIEDSNFYSKYGGKLARPMMYRPLGKNPYHISMSRMMNHFNTMGYNKRTGYFASGGEMVADDYYKPTGGSLVPIASNASLVKGDTHNQDSNGDGKTGVTLSDGNTDVAEVENNEVIYTDGNGSDFVFSNRLGFGRPATALLSKKGDLEKSLKTNTDKIVRNTLTRNISKLDMDAKDLYLSQKFLKKQLGISDEGDNAVPTAGTRGVTNNKGNGGVIPIKGTRGVTNRYDDGGNLEKLNKFTKGFGTFASTLAPFVDNYYNNEQINKRPDIPAPLLAKSMPIDPNVNVSPQLHALDESLNAYTTDINNNVSNSSTANASRADMYVKNVGMRNQILGYKENAERQARNANVKDEQGVFNQNQDKIYGYKYANFTRKGEIQNERMANVANLTNDVVQGIIDNRNSRLDSEKIGLWTRVFSLNNDAAVAQTWSDPSFRTSLKRMTKENRQFYRDRIEKGTDKTLKESWNKEFPDEKIDF